ncbi:hypothetical protein ONZ43_g5813 [Nemania bipapillata]|uniref:Uncharacterized protein n=1 Tax=Nemania bipapillata TaxID=110536 RepID=A0ACC2I670_9PEZI|nr:hypothetical protein ONZ43_g5813 [Nemania bipapillata]
MSPSIKTLAGIRPGPSQWASELNDFRGRLIQTAHYRATDPRDKIFALESLLPRCVGKLIHVDYNEDHHAVFTRVTAQMYNSYQELVVTATWPLLVETETDDRRLPSAPSWVLDFTFSDTSAFSPPTDGFRQVEADLATAKITLGVFIYRNHSAYFELICKKRSGYPLLATPKALFCSGLLIDSVYKTGIIGGEAAPGLGPNAVSRGHTFLSFLAFLIQVRAQRQETPRTPKSSDPDGPLEEVISLLAFFLLQDAERVRGGDWEVLFNTRYPEVAGKMYFITKQGFVGISTVRVKEGDALAFLGDAVINFVLREVNDPEQDPAQGQVHRIVARAAVLRDKSLNLPEWFGSFSRRMFHII